MFHDTVLDCSRPRIRPAMLQPSRPRRPELERRHERPVVAKQRAISGELVCDAKVAIGMKHECIERSREVVMSSIASPPEHQQCRLRVCEVQSWRTGRIGTSSCAFRTFRRLGRLRRESSSTERVLEVGQGLFATCCFVSDANEMFPTFFGRNRV